MEIVGGFMMMMSIIGFFLAMIWLIMPFVVFAVKGKQDRTLDVLEAVEKRLADIDERLKQIEACNSQGCDFSVGGSDRQNCDSNLAGQNVSPL